MRMYVSILNIQGVWKVYSPDVKMEFVIDKQDYDIGIQANKEIVDSIKNKLTVMPDPTYVVITKTKQWLREQNVSIDSFIKVEPIEF